MNHGIWKKIFPLGIERQGEYSAIVIYTFRFGLIFCKLKWRGVCRNTKRDFKILRRDGNENV